MGLVFLRGCGKDVSKGGASWSSLRERWTVLNPFSTVSSSQWQHEIWMEEDHNVWEKTRGSTRRHLMWREEGFFLVSSMAVFGGFLCTFVVKWLINVLYFWGRKIGENEYHAHGLVSHRQMDVVQERCGGVAAYWWWNGGG